MGILQARVPKWVAMPFSGGSSLAQGLNQASCIAGRFFTVWATWEAPTFAHLLLGTEQASF